MHTTYFFNDLKTTHVCQSNTNHGQVYHLQLRDHRIALREQHWVTVITASEPPFHATRTHTTNCSRVVS